MSERAPTTNDRLLLRAMMAATPDVLAVKDTGHRYLAVNDACARVFGRPTGDIVGRTDHELFPAEVAAALVAADRRVIADGVTLTLTELAPSAEHAGAVRVWTSVKAPLHDDDGRVVGVVVTARDETARHATDRALAAREAELRAFAEHTPVLMGLVEPWLDGGVAPAGAPAGGPPDILHVYDNPASCAFFGVPAGGTANQWSSALGAPLAVRATWARHYQAAADAGAPVAFEYAFGAPDGASPARRLAVTVAPVAHDGDGDDGGGVVAPRRFTYVAEDVTTARAAVARAGILPEVTAGLVVARSAAEVAEVVAAAGVRALGAAHGTVGLLDDWETDAPSDRPAALRVVSAVRLPAALAQRFARTPLDEPIPFADAARTGRPVYLTDRRALEAAYPVTATLAGAAGVGAVAALPLLAGGGDDGAGPTARVLGALVFDFADPRAFDADDRATLTALARQCAQALERVRLDEAERRARGDAERANQAKSQFLASMSHELRTPLNAIQGHVQLVEMGLHGPVTAPQAEALARVQAAQRHLLALINDVLSFARLEAGRVDFDVTAVPLGTLVAEVLPMVEPLARAKGLALVGPPADGPGPFALADADKLRQVVLNLLSNAVKFTPAGGEVRVGWGAHAAPAERVFVRVADTGVGIAAEEQERIFEPFVQVRAAQTPYAREHQGAGLGLAISRDLARGMGGELSVESRPGAGATFTVDLAAA